MEKYNYDFLADQEPDGNSEWYPAKEVEKEIEQYKHTLTHDTKEIKLLTAEIDQKDEEIERLRGAIIKTVQDAEVREEKLDKEIERLRIERDYWKTTLIAELEENESGDGVDNEMHEHEKALQQALKESGR